MNQYLFFLPTRRTIIPRTAAILKRYNLIRGLKETSSQNPNLSSDIERHKQDMLNKLKNGQGHWKPELASDSEEAIFADKSHNHEESIEDLQRKTANHAEAQYKNGTSQGSGL